MGSNFAELQPDAESLGSVGDFASEFIEALHTQPLMQHFTDTELTLLAEYMDCFGVPSSSVAIREGDEGDFMAILVTGSARITKRHGDIEVVLGDLKPGELVGEMSLIDGQRRCASCVTLEPSDFAVLNHARLNHMLTNHPRLGNKFLLMLIGLSTSRLRRSNMMAFSGPSDPLV